MQKTIADILKPIPGRIGVGMIFDDIVMNELWLLTLVHPGTLLVQIVRWSTLVARGGAIEVRDTDNISYEEVIKIFGTTELEKYQLLTKKEAAEKFAEIAGGAK